MTAGIYCLYFEQDDSKVYVGQQQNIEDRYKRHIQSLALDAHHSWKLQSAYYKFLTLPKSMLLAKETQPQTRNLLEQLWIEEFSQYTDGYNCTPGDGSVSGRGILNTNILYNLDQYTQAVELLAWSSLTNQEIALETGLTVSIIANIQSGRRLAWLEERYDLEFEIIYAKDRTILKDKQEIIGLCNYMYNNPRLKMTEVSANTGISLKKIQHLRYGAQYGWLQKVLPIEYNSIINRPKRLHP